MTHRVLDVEMGSTEPGANVLLWEPKKAGYDNQLWTYEDEVFVNKHSNLVLYLPSVGDQVIRGTSLIQAKPINQTDGVDDDDPMERYKRSWGVDPQGRIFSWLDDNFCIAPGEGVSVVVEDCFFGDVDDMVWRFVPAQPVR
ncbi:hypothetical protein AGABI1DRAFT_117772 [Agaricus bisporus var. burnettii JB137-S8]|uniref:Uncharacterized protein n=1 Tax=Agaricus bisporus var. burnettii (strain JB137-S8 / ATCC MYA-4627 / FGSC 10392) TaxID=597362 RepID=K5X8Y6_AGABU|nr:uncharacterized protein AGABI1DRAFT_117772 [Agaricus bisporus var. burnettii JB137-S8]EKM84401.1 hypothetical protein AGABI1DRAFT_117772 [Agaricus bisporus var. burnettii JB137-S8]